MKVAYYTPAEGTGSGVGDYAMLLLPALRERIEEVIVAEPGKRAPSADVAVYHVGNDPTTCGWIVDALRKRPGIVVLHDFVLHHLIAGITVGRGDSRAYLAAMEREFGITGRLIALGMLDDALPHVWETKPERFPLVTPVLDLAQGVIVHSHYVERKVIETGYAGPVCRIQLQNWPVAEVEPAELPGSPIIGCFGNLNMNKRIPQLLEAFAEFRQKRPDAKLLLVGRAVERFDLNRRLERLELGDSLIREEFVPEERFWALMAACDVLVNLRSPTMGETSGAVIGALSLGKAMIVSDIGWFAELPDSVALKIPVDEYEVATLAGALKIASDHHRELGEAGRVYVRREHDIGRVADSYVSLIEEVAGREAVTDRVLWRLAEAAAETGITDTREIVRQAQQAGIL